MVFVGICILILSISITFFAVCLWKGFGNIKINTVDVNIISNTTGNYTPVNIPQRDLSNVETVMVKHPEPGESIISHPTIVPDMSILKDAKIETNMEPETAEFKSNPTGFIKSVTGALKKTKRGKEKK